MHTTDDTRAPQRWVAVARTGNAQEEPKQEADVVERVSRQQVEEFHEVEGVQLDDRGAQDEEHDRQEATEAGEDVPRVPAVNVRSRSTCGAGHAHTQALNSLKVRA